MGATESGWTSWRKSSRSGSTGNGGCIEVAWRKSSYSGGGNGDCVEVAWRKSSYSGTGNGGCVEVAVAVDRVGVRDSKQNDGPALGFGVAQWRAFLATAR